MDQRQQEMYPNNFPGPVDGMANGVPETGERMLNGPSSNNVNSNNNRTSLSSLLSKAMENQKPPGWQLDLMMEKLRQKSKQLKPLAETAKNIRMALQERRQILDQVDRMHLQKNLDVLQQSIKVNSLQSMVERLEMVSRQLGLKFTPGSNGNEWFISSDMFYLELLIDQYGQVKKVQIQHDGRSEQQNVPEMVDCLCRNDFTDFTSHLEGLVAIYQLNADKKIKNKAFIALQAMEADLAAVASTYGDWTDGETVVMKSKLGLLQPRKGGHAVKLVYFISPYDFLDTDGKSTLVNDVQTIVEKKLGCVANVSIQASTSRKLQMSTTVSLTRRPENGRMEPKYGILNATNSTVLPACFVINLAKPMPICKEVLNAIQKMTTIPSFDMTDSKPLLGLITRHSSNGSMDSTNNRGLFVALPDTADTLQVHCYFMTENVGLEGIVVSSIQFTLASQLASVISLLRQQALFNSLISTCVRVGCKPEMDCMVFEISALSHQNISVSFQHPLEDSLVTLEFDLKDVAHPMCRLHAVTNFADIKPTLEEHACRVVQRSLSIPVTVRAVIRRWQSLKSKHEPPPGFTVPVGGSYGAERFSQSGSDLSCGTASEKVQNQQQQQSSQQSMVPGMVMGISSGASLTPVTSAGGSTLSGARHSSGNGSSYTISPVPSVNPLLGMNIPPAGGFNAADLMNSFTNPFLQNQSGAAGNFLNMANFQNFLDANKSLASLIDQGQRGKRRKRKGTNDSNTTSPVGSNASVTRPSPSPSPKSPRAFIGNNKSPKRRPSEGSDISDTSLGGDGSRSATPLTPRVSMDSNTALANMLMSETGVDFNDPRWNIELTPVPGPIGRNDGPGDMESDSVDSVFGGKKLPKRKEFPKRSASLDSTNSGGNLEEIAANLHSLMNAGASGSDSVGSLVTPSLSITPVSQNSGPSNVNSLLAQMRPGIEIIPLPNTVQLPSSITLTPIQPKPGSQQHPSSQENKKILPGAIKMEDMGDTGTTLKKKLSTSSLPEIKKDRKRKASNTIPPLLDEDGMVVHDIANVKQPKLSGPFSTNTNASLFPSLEKKNSAPATVGGSGITVSFKGSSPTFKMGQQKSSSSNLQKSPLSKVSSPGPKIGGKPSVSALKSATSSSPKVDKSGKITKDKKNNGNKIVKNLSLGNSLPVPLMPALKALTDTTVSGGLNLSTLHPGLLGLSAGGSGKMDPALAEQMVSMFSKAMEASKQQQMLIQSAAPTVTMSSQTTTTASGSKPQMSSSSAPGPLSSKKGGGIMAVINKLHSSQLSKDDTSKTNEGKMDYQKVSSAITNDVQQRKQAGGNTSTSNGNTPTTTGGSFTGSNQQEYTVKTGGNSGLKMKLSISKSSIKEKTKAGLNKIMGNKKPVTSGQKPTLGSPQSTKSFPGASTPPGKKNGNGKGPDSSEKKSKNGNGNANTTTKPSSEERAELAKTLFLPGAASRDPAKFDVTKYQIPKKSSSSQGGDKEKDTSPKSSNTESQHPKQSDRDTPTKEMEKMSSKPKELIRSESPSSNSCPPVLSSFAESKPAEKIKLSSAAVSDMPFLQEMNSKVFVNSPSSVGSPMNLSQSFRGVSSSQESEDKKQNDKPPVLERAVPKVDSTSPESPDPANIPHDDNIYKNTKTIPTAPIVPIPLVPDTADTSEPSSPSGDDEDKLVIDMREKGPKELNKEQNQQEEISSSATDLSIPEVDNKSKETFVVPPPPPEPVSSTTNSSSSSSNGGGSRSVGSPAPVVQAGNSIPEPKELSTSVTSPLPATVSVHIVHSPQPNSPAFQRSPLVVQSPHSSHASPYAVDDDLMDEAVTGK